MPAATPHPHQPPETHSPAVQSAIHKIFRRVVPLFFIMFVANYMDRVNLGFAQDQLRADVGLSAAAFGLGAGIFFIAYAIFEVPSNCSPTRRCCSSCGSTSPSTSPCTR